MLQLAFKSINKEMFNYFELVQRSSHIANIRKRKGKYTFWNPKMSEHKRMDDRL